MNKLVYEFSEGKAEGNGSMKSLLGGKGAALAEMSLLNIPVPPGFTVSTEYCHIYYDNKITEANSFHQSPCTNFLGDELKTQVKEAISNLEQILKREFNPRANFPLLLSVRSGSPISMPGMMDTILNLGLNDYNVESLATLCNPKFAYDSYRRFIQMYGTIVMGLDSHLFEDILDYQRRFKNVAHECELDLQDLQEITLKFKDLLLRHNVILPQEPYEQLWQAIKAVLGSWMNPRAVKYRELHHIPSGLGTAVNIQAMVFGNMGENNCATGVLFTRDPSTGIKEIFGEFLLNAQGEDVVNGSRDAYPITEKLRNKQGTDRSMEMLMPEAFQELMTICNSLEHHYRNMQDIEFTVENGKVWILQTRNGKRSVNAALKIASDMVKEGLLSIPEALKGIEASSLDKLLHRSLDPDHKTKVIGLGLPASPGAAYGAIALTAQEAEKMSLTSPVILVRPETSPDDISGMSVAQGIITARGGMTSHAAVVARGMGKPCLCSVSNLKFDFNKRTVSIGEYHFKEGDIITIDGSTGKLMQGMVALVEPKLSEHFTTIMQWADDISALKVRANADTIEDVKTALNLGAMGIGLCRTEHMFFSPDRILAIRKMILADGNKEESLRELEVYQKHDFIEIFTLMKDKPVTIRLLDPPLHEFLPQSEAELEALAIDMKCNLGIIKKRVKELEEQNPMLGHRGCRLGITWPEIYLTQAKAIFEAALEVGIELGLNIEPEIMLPFILDPKEIILLHGVIEQARQEILSKWSEKLIKLGLMEKDKLTKLNKFSNPSLHQTIGITEEQVTLLSYKLGTMIEIPRAALLAEIISPLVDFFSFGTNDLTQTSLGLSRDDSASFMKTYLHKGVFKIDPFTSLDISGVGELIKIAVERGRKANPNIKLGVCGEHGGDPASIAFFVNLGLDYVSCSPYRVPIARLSIAQNK